MPGEALNESLKFQKTEQKKLNDYINPLLADKDPDNGIEEEYKHKYKQAFCWRFLRAVSFID